MGTESSTFSLVKLIQSQLTTIKCYAVPILSMKASFFGLFCFWYVCYILCFFFLIFALIIIFFCFNMRRELERWFSS